MLYIPMGRRYDFLILRTDGLDRLRCEEDVVDVGTLFRDQVEVEVRQPILQIVQIKPAELQNPVCSPDVDRRLPRTDCRLAYELAARLQHARDFANGLRKQLKRAAATDSIKGFGFERERKRAAAHVVDVSESFFASQAHGSSQHHRGEIKSDDGRIRHQTREASRDVAGPGGQVEHHAVRPVNQVCDPVEVFREGMLARNEIAKRTPYSFVDGNRSFHLHQLLERNDRLFRSNVQVKVAVFHGKAGAAVHASQATGTIKRMLGPVGAEPTLVIAATGTTLKCGDDVGNVRHSFLISSLTVTTQNREFR